MLRVGLSGGIGAGKSTVSAQLAQLGAVVIDSDKIAREVVQPGTDGLHEIRERFGAGVLTAEGRLDRPALANVVFGDDTERAALAAILHPRIGARTAELTHQAPRRAIVVHDVPLLVENGLAPNYQLVIIVDAAVGVRLDRLARTRDMPEEQARSRMAGQADTAARRRVADVWLDNSGGTEELHAMLDRLWRDRLVPFEANLTERRCPPRGAPAVVAPDPTWPDQARRLIDRLAVVVGSAAHRIDHVGSTSVPGLMAADVIDIQLLVAELPAADALAETLEENGFPIAAGCTQDGPFPPGSDPAESHARAHCSADPARAVNLALRVTDAPAARLALLFPAWLRADAEARAEYGAVQRGLAVRPAPDGGAREKASWFARALPRARQWASSSRWTP
ncbi:MAG: dephospho-CoA kinase [Sciscionella sp.]